MNDSVDIVTAVNVSNLSYCERYQPNNPYCGIFGAGEIVEVIFLFLFAVVGTLGNLMVISSIIVEKRSHKHGNMFIINLAIADLIVTGFFLPTVIANVIKTENSLSSDRSPECQFAGYIVTVTCACSVCNLALIALNRYWAVVRSSTYNSVFSKRNIWLMIVFSWLWSNLMASPTLFGWSSLLYDYKMAQCGWDDSASMVYNVGLMICAIFLPVVVIVFCYWRLYISVKKRGAWFQNLGRTQASKTKNAQQQRMLRREINLLKTLAATIILFVLCWTPYAVVIVFFSATVPPRVKKAVARLGLSNSVVNFVVYGVMNPTFRKGYKHLLYVLCCCEKANQNLRSVNSVPLASLPAQDFTPLNKRQDINLTEANQQDCTHIIAKLPLATNGFDAKHNMSGL